jgi:hypothetical protein
MLEKKRLTLPAQSRLEKTLSKAQDARKPEMPKDPKPESSPLRKAENPS